MDEIKVSETDHDEMIASRTSVGSREKEGRDKEI